MWLTFLILAVLPGCGSGPSAQGPAPVAAPQEFQAVDVLALKAAMESDGAVLLDVRTPDEYAGGHIPGAQSFPIEGLADRLEELAPHKAADLHLVCASGGRSALAQGMLAQAGFAHPINVEGGTRAWIAAGLPVE